MNLGVSVFDSRSFDTAKRGAHLKRNVLLPQSLSVGMTVVTEKDHWKVKEVRWFVSDQSHFLVLEEKFKEADIGGTGCLSFEEWLEKFAAFGWNCTDPFHL